MTAEALLQVVQVDKTYGGFTALRGIDLTLREGEFVCLLGPSGCGKSTLLRLIAGLATASVGQVRYRDAPVVGVNPYTTIVFQTFALFPWLTVAENVEVALKARGVDAETRGPRAQALIEMVGLAGFESAYPREISGGMRQKVGFARAMAVEPELLCLDEPFSALDVLSAESLRGELLDLWHGRRIPTRAILMVTHNIEEAVLMADRIVVMGKDPGRIITEIPVRLHAPRQRKDTAFQALVDTAYAAVAGRTGAEHDVLGTSPGTPGATRRLPDATLERVAGLSEAVASEGGRVDLPRLAADLGLDLDALLALVEAAERLGLARVEQGDLFLTPLGRSYAAADMFARREVMAGRVLRVPLVRWVYETLERDDNQHVDRGYFTDALRPEFGDDVDHQVDLAVDWGRFAGLFAYDADTNELYLET